MKSIYTLFTALLLPLFGCTAQTTGFRSLTADEFEKEISNQHIICLDVRTAQEYAEGHLPDAINIDVQGDEFAHIASATLPKQHTIAVYCRSGRRSKKAAEILTSQGYKVLELSTGYNGWTGAGKVTTREEVDMFCTQSGQCIYTYCIKHGSVRMRIADKWVYVDPVTDKVQPVTDYTTMPKADLILITHEHADHLDAKAIEQLTHQNTILVTNPNSSAILGGKGNVMKNGDKATQASITIEAVPAYNSSAQKQQFHPRGRDNGYILNYAGMRIYLAGDTEDIPEMAQVGHIDVAFLPCNLPFTMSPDQLANAAHMVNPRVLFPYHYGQTDVQQVVKLLDGSGIDVRIRQYQ